MEIELKYNPERGVYMLNGFRVILLPSGGLESIQEAVNSILGLATKSIFEDSMAVTTYSLLLDLINSKKLKRHGEERMEAEIFDLFNSMGFGYINIYRNDGRGFSVIRVSKNFNSILGLMKSYNYCFQSLGQMASIFRVVFGKNASVEETHCKSTGDSDTDTFNISIKEESGEYAYIPSQKEQLFPGEYSKVEIKRFNNSVLVNDIPVEIVPVGFFPYLFGKLHGIVGQGVYGIENSMGRAISRIYDDSAFERISSEYAVEGFEMLSPLMGIGKVTVEKGELGSTKSINIDDDFNSLHIDNNIEKRCFLTASLLSGLSFRLSGSTMNIKETACSAENNGSCVFGFGGE